MSADNTETTESHHGVIDTSDESWSAGRCPVMHTEHMKVGSTANQHWWPEQINTRILRQNHPASNPLGDDFDYASAVQTLDFDQLAADVDAVLTDSKEWWPADFGNYGPLFIRLSWHAAGTYRTLDGRGGGGAGAQRFAPLNSWPDNANLDKARRLLWPVKQKYGSKLSWADLLVFAGNRALDAMGFKTFGFAFGRDDIWGPEEDVYWGPETTWLDDQRYSGDRDLERPLGAVQMGLIYVNPEGPNGNPDPMAAARDIRETFARMAMNDEETVALIAGGHTFGKTHGAADGDEFSGPEPEGAKLHEQGFGWTSSFGTGMGDDSITSGLEVTWTSTPTQWSNKFFENMFKYDWELTESPAGAKQWTPKGDVDDADMVPVAHDPSRKIKPAMLTTDLALKVDPVYKEISERFLNDADAFADAFARAWYKLLHRDMGPKERFLGPWVPDEELLWMDPIPASTTDVSDADIADLKAKIAESGLSVQQLVGTAWAAASTYRCTDKRGGANGGRLRLSPQSEWDVNVSSGTSQVISKLESIAADAGKQITTADMIVLGGVVGVEQAAKAAGHDVTVPFSPGRGDATQEQTDAESFSHLEPKYDGFRNYLQKGNASASEHLLLDRAFMLGLSAPEMTALVGGMRAIGANAGDSKHGILTDRVGQLTNDFFVNLLDMDTVWTPTDETEAEYEGRARSDGSSRWTATRVDLVFGSNSELRALAEVYAQDGGQDKLVHDFVAAWAKVMDNDRFDLD